jgi:WD40 repeat protein
MKYIWMRKFPEILFKQYFGSYSAAADHPPLFFTGSDDRTVRIWDVAAQQQVAELKGHTSTVMSVAFDSSGKYLASGERRGA